MSYKLYIYNYSQISQGPVSYKLYIYNYSQISQGPMTLDSGR